MSEIGFYLCNNLQAKRAMTMKQMSGMMKPIAILVSPMTPINTGAMAPPTMLIMRKDAPLFVSLGPKPCNANAKMVGNIMASQRYVSTNATNVDIPEPKMTQDMQTIPPMAQDKSTLLAEIRFISQLPPNLPTKNKPIPPNESNIAAVRAEIVGTFSVT